MIILVVFAFLGGIVTILSPCIITVLPFVLSGSVGDGKNRPWGIVVGFVASFTFFTLFLTAIVNVLNVPANVLRYLAITILIVFGLSLIVPKLREGVELFFSKLTSKTQTQTKRTGFLGGVVVGVSLGLLWTPCVGPILAAVISLALTSSVTTSAVFIALAYAVGTAIPMFLIMKGGRKIFEKVNWLKTKSALIQQIFGGIMIIMAILIIFNIDRKLQIYVIDNLPDYSTKLTKFERVKSVETALDKLENRNIPLDNIELFEPDELNAMYEYSAVLEDVSGGEATGRAYAKFDGEDYMVLAELFDLPEPENDYFYEGWIDRKSPLSVLSTGKAFVKEGVYVNEYSAEGDLSDHDFYVLTIEPNDGDPAPADHILEGTLSK